MELNMKNKITEFESFVTQILSVGPYFREKSQSQHLLELIMKIK